MTNQVTQETLETLLPPAEPMKIVVIYGQDGMIMFCAQIPPEVPESSLVLPGCAAMAGNSEVLQNPSAWRVDTSGETPALVSKTVTDPSHGRWFIVDVATGQTTEAPREDVLSDVSLLVARAMKGRSIAPVTVDGVVFDADKTAQDNIKAKLIEIAALRRLDKEMPAELLVWRDHANTTHTFPNMGALEIKLSEVVAQIAQRGTELYMWNWAVKAHCATLGSAQEIRDYLLSEGVTV